MKRREKELERERERNLERKRTRWGDLERERESTQGDAGFESETRASQTRESRRADATNAGFDTRVQVITREERGRGLGFRVALA